MSSIPLSALLGFACALPLLLHAAPPTREAVDGIAAPELHQLSGIRPPMLPHMMCRTFRRFVAATVFCGALGKLDRKLTPEELRPAPVTHP